jgi:hypothetical protein
VDEKTNAASSNPSWRFSPEQLRLIMLQDGVTKYSVDLTKITSSAHMLDLVFDVSAKAWANHQIVGELIEQLRELFDPRATLCREGRDHKMDPVQHLRRCRARQ